MDFDYYQIKGKWNAATLNRRAEKLEEAQAAADELEEDGAKGVEIIGVKAGKRETIRGKKKATKAAKTPKAAKVPTKKKKAYTAPKMKVKAQEKPKPKKAAPKVEPAGQLNLFANTDKKKDEIWRFDLNELNYISMALKEFFPEYIKEPLKLTTKEYDELINCFERAKMRGGNINITLNEFEQKNIIRALQFLRNQDYIYDKDYIRKIEIELYNNL